MEKLLEILGKGTVQTAFEFLKSIITTKKDKMEWLDKINNLIREDNAQNIELREKLIELYKLLETVEFDDVKSAREMNKEINISPNSTWLSKNITALLAVFFVLSYTVLNVFIIYFPSEETQMLKLKVLDSFQNIMLLIVGFYFGSSAESSVKDRIMNLIDNNKNKEYKETTKNI